MHLQHSFLAAALLATLSPSVAAQSSGAVSMRGSILPSTCTITLGNSGVADFGQIPFGALSAGSATALAPMNVSAVFACSGPTQFVVSATDNVLPSGNTMPAARDAFGLGATSNGVAIGLYTLDMNTPLADGVPGAVIASGDLQTWTMPAADTKWEKANDQASTAYRGFGAAPTGPVAVLSASVNVRISPSVRPRSELQLTQDESFDGNATIEVTYL